MRLATHMQMLRATCLLPTPVVGPHHTTQTTFAAAHCAQRSMSRTWHHAQRLQTRTAMLTSGAPRRMLSSVLPPRAALALSWVTCSGCKADQAAPPPTTMVTGAHTMCHPVKPNLQNGLRLRPRRQTALATVGMPVARLRRRLHQVCSQTWRCWYTGNL